MGYILFCDSCSVPIKEGDTKHILALNTVKQQEEQSYQSYVSDTDAMQHLLEEMRLRRKNVRFYEICDKCKKVFDYFFDLRIDEVKKIQEELDKKYEQGDNEDDSERQI